MTERHAAALTDLRLRVTALVGDLEPDALDVAAPATPGWRARDVLAHMVGVADDIVNGRRDGIASDAWTAAQVDRRRDSSVAQMLSDWDRWGPGFEAILAVAPAEIAGQAVFDAATHEHDVRHAVARPGARASDAVECGWDWLVDARRRAGAPAIRFVSERGDDAAGVGEPRITVRAPQFALFRAVTGRRAVIEMARYEWEPAPDPTSILAAPFFTIRAEPLGE